MTESPADRESAVSRADVFLTLAILLLGIFVRFYGYEDRSWDSDQPTHYLRALALSRGETWDLLVGFPTRANGARLPALYHQILSISCHFGGPLVTAGFLTLCQLAVCPIIIFLGRSIFGREACYCAALIFALSPSLVSRSQTFANELMAMPLACLYLLLILRARGDSSSPAAGWAFACAIAFGQIHLSSLFTLALTGPLCLYYAYRNGFRRALPGFVLGLLLLAPFMTHEIQNNFRESRRLIGQSQSEKTESKTQRKKAQYLNAIGQIPKESIVWFGSDWTFEFVGPAILEDVSSSFIPFETISRTVSFAVLLAGVGALVFALTRSGADLAQTAPRFVALMLTAHWLMYWIVNLEVDPYYMLVITPHIAILLGCFFNYGLKRVLSQSLALKKIGLTFLIGSSLIIFSTWLFTPIGVMNAIRKNGGNNQSIYGPSYRTQRAAFEWIFEKEARIAYLQNLHYAMSLEIVFRELPPEKQARFVVSKTVLPFWNLPMLVIFPKYPQGSVSIIDCEATSEEKVLAQFGHIRLIDGIYSTKKKTK